MSSRVESPELSVRASCCPSQKPRPHGLEPTRLRRERSLDGELPERARPGQQPTEPGRTTPLPRTDRVEPTLLGARIGDVGRPPPEAR